MKPAVLIDGSSLLGRTWCPVDLLRHATTLALVLAGGLLVIVATAGSIAHVVVGSAPDVRIPFRDVVVADPVDTPISDAAMHQPEPAAEANRGRPIELDMVLSVVREHRRGADEVWCETLAEAIYSESVASEVDPLLITSIVALESSFQSQVVSRMGAVGLMQLRPFVAEDVALRQNIEWTGHQTLHSPHLNVRMGISYYKQLLVRFDGDTTMALTAYNLGPTRVSRLVRSGTYSGSEYAARILHAYAALRDGRGWPTSPGRSS